MKKRILYEKSNKAKKIREDMQLIVNINLDEPLVLPLNYNHILQSIIYRALSVVPDYADFVHDMGYSSGNRSFKMFHFSQLMGEYRIQRHNIIFDDFVSLEIRSPQPLFINILRESFECNGIIFGEKIYHDIFTEMYDYTVEESELLIEMKSPLTVYSSDTVTGKTYYYEPTENEFAQMVDDNFKRKYYAYYGIRPVSSIELALQTGYRPRKLVTKYQGVYVNAWFGRYCLKGERKYLDFLYQTGLGAKNAQGFGMFGIL